MPSPKFHVNKDVNPPEVWVLCTTCDAKIKQVMPNESISVMQAYYCKEHDDGAIHLNPPTNKKEPPEE